VPSGTVTIRGVFHMTTDRRVLGSALAALLLVAACGGSASSAPTNAPEATAQATEQPSETQAPAETQAPESPDVSLNPGAAGELEAMLPDEVGGVAFEKGSFDGETVPGGIPLGEGDDALATFLSDNGKTLRDVKIAVATPADTASGGGTVVMAIQVEGVSEDKLEEFAVSSMDEGEKTTVGGKEVYGAGMAGFGAYVYVKDDVIFYVLSMGGEAAVTEGIFERLP
jgi:hypothetical protein